MKITTLPFLIVLAFLLTACDNKIRDKPAVAAAPEKSWIAVAKGYISVEGDIVSIDTPRTGIITEVLVEEGTHVRKGDILARIEDNDVREELHFALKQQEEAIQDRALSQQKLRIAQREFQRIANLGTSVLSAKERDNANDQITLAQREIALKEAALSTATAKIRAAQLEVDMHVIRAPIDGMIVKRYARPGEGASTLNVTRLFTLVPDTQRIVRADLEDIFVDVVKPGQRAEVTLENNDNKIYSASVLRLGNVFGVRSPDDDPMTKQDTRVIECVLTIDAQDIRVGQRVRVRIFPDSVSAAQIKAKPDESQHNP